MSEIKQGSRTPYTVLKQAEERASHHAALSRLWAKQADEAATDNAHAQARSAAAVSQAHASAAMATMVADGCIAVQDLKR